MDFIETELPSMFQTGIIVSAVYGDGIWQLDAVSGQFTVENAECSLDIVVAAPVCGFITEVASFDFIGYKHVERKKTVQYTASVCIGFYTKHDVFFHNFLLWVIRLA
jgi:hypothetical protein